MDCSGKLQWVDRGGGSTPFDGSHDWLLGLNSILGDPDMPHYYIDWTDRFIYPHAQDQTSKKIIICLGVQGECKIGKKK